MRQIVFKLTSKRVLESCAQLSDATHSLWQIGLTDVSNIVALLLLAVRL